MIEIVVWRLGFAPSGPQQDLEYQRVLRADPCSYCGGPSAVTDHIEARAIGGKDGWWNLTAACKKCNARKSSRSLLSFLLGNAEVGLDHRELERRRGRDWRRRYEAADAETRYRMLALSGMAA